MFAYTELKSIIKQALPLNTELKNEGGKLIIALVKEVILSHFLYAQIVIMAII